ncbi:MAG: hypothetical protein HEP71_11960 [Roseivirga sp.]|nr:hypothetical protein [Roseivirga sp.]
MKACSYRPGISALSIILLIGFLATSCSEKRITFKSESFELGLNKKGEITAFRDITASLDYHFKDTLSSILSIWQDGVAIQPESASFVENTKILSLEFPGDRKAEVLVGQKDSHITFELTAMTGADEVDLVLWGPYPTTIDGVIGETVGVVRNKDFAIGIQSLNPKTLGGYPWNDNDAMPQIDIFEGGDYSDLSEKGKRYVLYRVEAAKPTDFGSTLQAYTRNRSKERVIKNWSKDQYVAPAYDDGGVIGSKIALFGSTERDALETLGKIELAEGLPHPMIDGKWGKTTRTAAAAYMIMGFSEKNIDRAIDYTKQAGLRYLYHDGPFKTWGNFELNDGFPNGRKGMKAVVAKAETQGIMVGAHTLSNFITTNDAFVTPVPDDRLAKVGSSQLSSDVNTSQKEIPIESSDFFRQMKNNSLKTVQIGKELIRYGGVSEAAPWKLLDCQRGAYGTKITNHPSGSEISLLADHAYKVFLTNAQLGDEMAKNLADLYNETGLRQISFDGVEGNRSTGMGNYGEILFTKAWYDGLSDDIKSHYIADASRTTHYFWHIYTRMNWGEPWYAGFRESQTEYRLKNQKYFQRNYMPGMLGWFSMRPTTSIEDIEWMLARSAAFNAGYAFVTNFDALEKNGYTEEILSAIGEWEKARMADVFSEEQRLRMEDINNEFHLETLAENQWNLYQVFSHKFSHEKKVRQPGEPLYSSFEFENETGDNRVQFILSAVEADLSNISLELNNYKKVVLPLRLKNGQSLKYEGGKTATLLNENWQKIREVDLNIDLAIKNGDQTINLDCTFSNAGKEPKAKLEVRIMGKAEPVSIQ